MRSVLTGDATETLVIPAFLGLTLAAGLYVDQRVRPWGQAEVDVVVGLVYAWLVLRVDGPRRIGLLVCLAVATVGECVASLGWGLYTYRLHNIPLFVPPGHALLYTMGVGLARLIPARAVPMVPLATLPYALLAWIYGFATFDVALYAVFMVCFWFGPDKRLYATMFVLSLGLELYGTWLGNWHWWPHVPRLELTSLNPPVAAGAFYCLLDLVVAAGVPPIERRLRNRKASLAPSALGARR